MTALRWASILRGLGHEVRVMSSTSPESLARRASEGPEGGAECDALVALHAVKSATAVADFKRRFPARPAVVALTGTDIFQDGTTADTLNETLRVSDRILALQNHMASAVQPEHRHKVRVIFQSFTPPHPLPDPNPGLFEVCVLGHLRDVKDPFLAAKAVRSLPPESRIRITHVGGALEPGFAERAEQEQATNPRYEWLGEVPRAEAVRVLARCRLLVMSSKSEGGPSAVSEAVACGVPVLSTPTSGVVGLLGEDYPGYFPVGDCGALKTLLRRCETDSTFLGELRAACDRVRPLIEPAAERAAWKRLLTEIGIG